MAWSPGRGLLRAPSPPRGASGGSVAKSQLQALRRWHPWSSWREWRAPRPVTGHPPAKSGRTHWRDSQASSSAEPSPTRLRFRSWRDLPAASGLPGPPLQEQRPRTILRCRPPPEPPAPGLLDPHRPRLPEGSAAVRKVPRERRRQCPPREARQQPSPGASRGRGEAGASTWARGPRRRRDPRTPVPVGPTAAGRSSRGRLRPDLLLGRAPRPSDRPSRRWHAVTDPRSRRGRREARGTPTRVLRS